MPAAPSQRQDEEEFSAGHARRRRSEVLIEGMIDARVGGVVTLGDRREPEPREGESGVQAQRGLERHARVVRVLCAP